MPAQQPVSAVARTYEFGVWLLERVSQFPRQHRFTLGDRIENGYLEILELLL